MSNRDTNMDLNRNSSIHSPKKYDKNQLIFSQGDSPDGMYFIARGSVKISFKEKDTHFVHNEGDTFGELGILLDLPRTATAQALGDVTIYKVMKTDFVEFLKHSPEVKAPCLPWPSPASRNSSLKIRGPALLLT